METKDIFAIVFLILMIITICKVSWDTQQNLEYKYIDLNGNKGIADVCYHDFGNLICKLEDGTNVKVAEYKEVEKG